MLSTSLITDMNCTRVTGSPRYSVRRNRVTISFTVRGTWYHPSSISGTFIVAFDSINVRSPYAIFIPFRPMRMRLGPDVGFPLVSPRTITCQAILNLLVHFQLRRKMVADEHQPAYLYVTSIAVSHIPMKVYIPNLSRNFSAYFPHNDPVPANKPILCRAIRTYQIPNSLFRCRETALPSTISKCPLPANSQAFHTARGGQRFPIIRI